MRALIVVDVQNDFLPGGALAVKDGDQVIHVINRIAPRFDVVVATQDWHPAGHGSFAATYPGKKVGDVIELGGLSQVLWPVHCVQGTAGAEFGVGLDMRPVEGVFRKGTERGIDSYSGFFDNGHKKATGLAGYLRERGATDVHVCGLATDYCVKFTALDAAGGGFRTSVIPDASRGVELRAGDVERAIADMQRAGVGIVNGGQV